MIRTWVGHQLPPVPEAFVRYLGDDDPVSVDGLVAAFRRRLATVLAGAGGGPREEAFALLAADAYATWACGLTLQDGGGATELEALVGRMVEGLA